MRIAVLDDWQEIARDFADWSEIERRAEVRFFHRPLGDPDAVVAALDRFEIILSMRERTPFPASVVDRLPALRMFGMTGHRAKAIDIEALLRRGVTVSYTEGGGSGSDTAEHTLALILAAARSIPQGDAAIRSGGFLEPGVAPGLGLEGRTLGIVGLGRIGQRMARYAQALDMNVIAWSRNLTPERASAAGATAVSREDLFARADVVTIHMLLTAETEHLVTAEDLARMKPGAIFVNTSRALLVDEAALLAAVGAGRIRAAIDVYRTEPLPADDPIRQAANTVLSPHVGFWTEDVVRSFYEQSVENALAFLDGTPIRRHTLAA